MLQRLLESAAREMAHFSTIANTSINDSPGNAIKQM